MTDHELRLRLRKLRVPAPGPDAVTLALDESLSALKCDGEHDGIPPHTTKRISTAESPWTWREWLWPSPLAWGSLAAIWLAIYMAGQPSGSPRPEHPVLADRAVQNRKMQTPDLLFAHHEYQLLLREHLKLTKFQ